MSDYDLPNTMDRLRALEKRVLQLEVSPRINDLDNLAVYNQDGTAPVFAVAEGAGVFPLPSCAWTPSFDYSGMDSVGRRTTTSTVIWNAMYWAVLPLMTPYIHYSLSPFLSGGATGGQMRFYGRLLDDRGTGANGQIGTTITLPFSYPNVQTGVLTVPSSLLDPQYSDVSGSMLEIWVETIITVGAGTLALGAVEPLYCTTSP